MNTVNEHKLIFLKSYNKFHKRETNEEYIGELCRFSDDSIFGCGVLFFENNTILLDDCVVSNSDGTVIIDSKYSIMEFREVAY